MEHPSPLEPTGIPLGVSVVRAPGHVAPSTAVTVLTDGHERLPADPAVSVGVDTGVGVAAEDSAEVWARADEALGRAKREGRNRVAGSITGRPAAAPGRG